PDGPERDPADVVVADRCRRRHARVGEGTRTCIHIRLRARRTADRWGRRTHLHRLRGLDVRDGAVRRATRREYSMSESIAEMVIPGTYIEVRAEGLISVGSIATGNIGVVGTASRGPVGEIVPLGSYSDALDAFGAYDAFDNPTTSLHPLSLTRTIEQLYRGGAGSVYAVRIANGTPVKAHADVHSTGAAAGFTLTAIDGGSFGNTIEYTVVNQGDDTTPNWVLTLQGGTTKETYRGA